MNDLARLPRPLSAPGLVAWSDTITLRTERRVQFVDLTALVTERVRRAGLHHGLVSVQVLHTTAGLLLNEAEPLLLEDAAQALDRLAPRGLRYRHDDLARRRPAPPPDERRNGHAHCQAMLLRTTESVHVVAGRLRLGRWQSLLLVERDGPQARSLSILALGTGAPA